MAAVGLSPLCLFNTPRRALTPSSSSSNRLSSDRFAVNVSSTAEKKRHGGGAFTRLAHEQEEDELCMRLKDCLEEVKTSGLIGSQDGPPRWFSPLDCASRARNSPLLLFLPGIDGTGLGLLRHHKKLGKMFDIWCLHIPFTDRTPAQELVNLVETTVKSENLRCPNRPIYIVGESLGACIALDVAARNSDIDLVLILANPATSFRKTMLQPLITLLDIMPEQLSIQNHLFGFMTDVGDPLKMLIDSFVKGFPLQHIIGGLSEDLTTISSYLTILASLLPKETFLWKLKMLKSASASANSHLHGVKAETLILTSGKDQWLPSTEEGERLRHAMPKCCVYSLNENGHFLFLEDNVDLVTIIKRTSFYRRGKYHDYVTDYMPPTNLEFENVFNSKRWLTSAVSPVMISTLGDGTVVKSLAGIPSEGPVIYVGYHMLLGVELSPMVCQLKAERNVHLRGIAHPSMFLQFGDELPEILHSTKDFRLMGALPVSATSMYRLLSSKAHVLLYPGGMREALHRKGEQYKLFWPEHSEFVRMASTFGAKIIPFGVVGEDDFIEMAFDYDDQMKIPFLKSFIEENTKGFPKLRTDDTGEVANQDPHIPIIKPKFPGRFYYYFGKPIETAGRRQELRDREKAQELYLQVKSEVESCIAFLLERRERDPYRYILNRVAYQAMHGFSSEVPTFEL